MKESLAIIMARLADLVQPALNYLYHLGPREITILVALTALLLLYLAYRSLGLGAVLALLLIYAMAYILYVNDIFHLYEHQERDNSQHMQEIKQELNGGANSNQP